MLSCSTACRSVATIVFLLKARPLADPASFALGKARRQGTLRQTTLVTGAMEHPGDAAEEHGKQPKQHQLQDQKGGEESSGNSSQNLPEQVVAGFRTGMGDYGSGYATRAEDEGMGQIYREPVQDLEGFEVGKAEQVESSPIRLSSQGNNTVDAAPGPPK